MRVLRSCPSITTPLRPHREARLLTHTIDVQPVAAASESRTFVSTARAGIELSRPPYRHKTGPLFLTASTLLLAPPHVSETDGMV